MTTRKIDNPLIIQIERAARRAERWQLVREIIGLILVAAMAFFIVMAAFRVFSNPPPTGTIIEDSRGPELKRLMDSALKEGR